MITIHKYAIQPGKFALELPAGADILHVNTQYDEPFMWVKVDTSQPPVERVFKVFGKGHELTDDGCWEHVGTFLMNGGSLVRHLFEHEDGTLPF